MIIGSIEDLYNHYAEIEARQNIAKKRQISYAQMKWLLPYKYLIEDKQPNKNNKQYFTDIIFDCKYIYDTKHDTWKCTS